VTIVSLPLTTTVNKRDYYCSIALFSHKKRQDLNENQIKKRNKGGTKMLEELLEKYTTKKKFCFMFW
jgi:hypothetical protein